MKVYFICFIRMILGFVSNKVVQLISVHIDEHKYIFVAYIYIPTNWLLLLVLSFIFA